MPRIGDFGLVRHDNFEKTEHSMNNFGSENYAAPEQKM